MKLSGQGNVGTQILLVGSGGDVVDLARHLEAVGYAVAYTTPADVVGVMGSLRPPVIMVMPGVPRWQKTQICSAIRERYPEPQIVLLRRRNAALSGTSRYN